MVKASSCKRTCGASVALGLEWSEVDRHGVIRLGFLGFGYPFLLMAVHASMAHGMTHGAPVMLSSSRGYGASRFVLEVVSGKSHEGTNNLPVAAQSSHTCHSGWGLCEAGSPDVRCGIASCQASEEPSLGDAQAVAS